MALADELEAESRKEGVGDPRITQIEALATELFESGVDFRVEYGKVIRANKDRDTDRELTLNLGRNRIRLAVVADTHGGSKFEQLTSLRAFYEWADEQEPDAFIHAGDFVQGSDRMHPGMEHEVHAHGADAQVDYVVATYPRSQRGTPTYAISGNHDDSFIKDGGINVVRQIAKARDDIVYLGQDAAYLTIGGCRCYVVHPDGGGAYAKSYKGQKFSESLPIEKRVALLLIGHYHNYVSFSQRDTEVFQLDCFQSQYAWLARKGLHPGIGGIVLDLNLNDDGLIVEMDIRRRRYRPIEHDWDQDVSTEVNRAWSSKGLDAA